MSRQRIFVFIVCVGFVTTACVVTFAQAQTSAPSRDAFSSINEAVTKAADRALAMALSNRSWMGAEALASRDNKVRSAVQTDPMLKVQAALDRVKRLRPLLEPILRDENVPV